MTGGAIARYMLPAFLPRVPARFCWGGVGGLVVGAEPALVALILPLLLAELVLRRRGFEDCTYNRNGTDKITHSAVKTNLEDTWFQSTS